MSGKIKESINQMLDSLVNGDKEDAANLLNNILADKVQSSLENMKADVADQYFNGVKEEVELEESNVEEVKAIHTLLTSNGYKKIGKTQDGHRFEHPKFGDAVVSSDRFIGAQNHKYMEVGVDGAKKILNKVMKEEEVKDHLKSLHGSSFKE